VSIGFTRTQDRIPLPQNTVEAPKRSKVYVTTEMPDAGYRPDVSDETKKNDSEGGRRDDG